MVMVRKGMTPAVSAILFVLLSVVAVTVLWAVVSNVLSKDVNQISTECLTLQAAIPTCTLDVTLFDDGGQGFFNIVDVTYRYERGTDEVDLQNAEVLFNGLLVIGLNVSVYPTTEILSSGEVSQLTKSDHISKVSYAYPTNPIIIPQYATGIYSPFSPYYPYQTYYFPYQVTLIPHIGDKNETCPIEPTPCTCVDLPNSASNPAGNNIDWCLSLQNGRTLLGV